MKKIILILSILFSCNNVLLSQENISIFTFNEAGNIITDSLFISSSPGELSSLSFSTSYAATISVDSVVYHVKIGRFRN